MIHFLSSLPLWLGIKSFIEKMSCVGVAAYAIRHKENVAVSYDRGKFTLVATGNAPRKLP